MAEKSASEYFTIEVEGHGSKLLHNLNRARLEERFCDFKLQVGKQIIHAHKNVLAEGCDYFRAMLSHSMKEANEGIVEMVDVDFECLQYCVEYIYLGKITIVKEKLQPLLEVAHRLQLNEFCEEAAKNLEDNLSVDTFFSTKSVATSLDLKNLSEKCDDFALKNLPGIALKVDFVEIDLKYLKFLMTAKVPPAVKCKLFLIWANHDADSRRKEFEEFFLNLDLKKLPPSYTAFLEQNEALFFNSNKCLRKSLQSKVPTNSCQDIDIGQFWKCKEFTRFAVFDRTSSAIQSYDPDEDTWIQIHKLTSEISKLDFTAIAVGEDIFVFADNKRSWKLRYSDKNSTWSALPNRSITRKVKVVEVDGLIYAFDEAGTDSKTVEMYDGSNWSHVTDKPVAGFQTYIVAVEDSVYCIGGLHGSFMYDIHSHCKKYDTRKKSWSSLPSMPEGRRHGGAAHLSQKIYVTGGYNWKVVTASTLIFDIETEVWTKVASMSNPRYYFCAVPIAGKIFSIGGYNTDGNSCDTVEEFNPANGKWRTVMALTGKRIVATASVAF